MVAIQTSHSISIQAERARNSFSVFAREAWPIIEPGKPYVGNWHLDAIAEHIQGVLSGDIKRLLVNMPPRHGKSSYIDVLAFNWSWLQNPSLRWLCASYAMNLATRDNLKCRRIIKSPWFQERYGEIFALTKDQDAKMKFENDKSGYRQAVSVGSAGTTGEGGDILMIDDPHPIEQKRSDLKREAVLDWFANTWSSRLNDERTGAMIVVGQRVHSQDVSGYILDGNLGQDWTHLNLATEYEPGSACRTVWPSGHVWKDPRTEDKELLWPEKFPRDSIEKKKRIHGPLGFASIHQQRPVPAGGNVFQKRNQRYFTYDLQIDCYLLETPRGIKPVPASDCWLLGTVDLAISEKQTADYTVFAAYAISPYKDLLLLDIMREHIDVKEQLKQLIMFQQKHNLQVIAVEDVAYQAAFIQLARAEGLPVQAFNPQGDKVARSLTASIWDGNGKSYHYKGAIWVFDYETEKFLFPLAPKDDQVDTHSMAGIVVCTRKVPGVLDLDATDNDKIDPTLSIEQVLDASQIAQEQQETAKEEQDKQLDELYRNGPAITSVAEVFRWADEHGSNGWEGDY